MDIVEIVPGVLACEDGVLFCPGCGCEGFGLDPHDPNCVRDWVKATFTALRDEGMECLTPELEEELIETYLKEPWHDSPF